MFRILAGRAGALALAFAALACASKALAAEAPVLKASYAAVGEATSVPYGWVEFCRRYAGECDHGQLPPRDVTLSAATFKAIDRINKWVNQTIVPITDWDHWHVVDQWDYPLDGKGDCEDFALFKRRLLIALGFPRQALLMTVVKDTHDEGHAILTVKTDHGEFVLDNLSDQIKPWNATPYHFVKRQSQADENVWLQIGPPTAEPAIVSR
ncbi:MAG: transglutaminase-like cysteine peptidase [Methylovirgula sp.]